MVTALRLTSASLLRSRAKTLVRVVVLAASVALLGGMLLFVGNSLRAMSASAVRSVPSPSRLFGVRRNSALALTRPRTQARVTTQLSANHTRIARTASPAVQPVVRRIAQSARSTPTTANASGTASTEPVSRRSGSWWWSAVATAVAMSRAVKQAVTTSPNHCRAPSR